MVVLWETDALFRIAAGALHGDRRMEIGDVDGRDAERGYECRKLKIRHGDGDDVGNASGAAIAATGEREERARIGVP
jgi:hypothetical protein